MSRSGGEGPLSDYRADTGRIASWLPLRRHHALLVGWTVLWFVLVAPSGGVSWHYLRQGEQLLFGGTPDGGLSLYANHPDLQIGPVSLAVARLSQPFAPAIGQLLAEAAMSVLGLVMLILVGRTAALHYLGTGTNHRRLQQRILVAGLAFIPMWIEVSVRFAHLDDVLALFFATVAVHSLAKGGSWAVAVWLALAVDAKPTAVPFAVLLLALPRGSRRGPFLLFCAVVAVAWLPFYLGNLGSVSAAQFAIPNQPASSLRWLGVHSAGTPSWDRPAQFGLGALLGAIAIWRGRWPAVILLGADARILLDPSTYTYYSASVLLGTLLWDAVGQRRLVPWWSWIALLSLYGGTLVIPDDPTRGLVRLGFVVLSVSYVLLWPTPGRKRQRGRRRSGATARRGRVPAAASFAASTPAGLGTDTAANEQAGSRPELVEAW
ncbi:hypothetical protein ABH931_005167 [Streptacidiphilus sp. MAP12-33]|uniref:hypothetical protein n=1 Tax=Streptacidiphilus sp. MAP12-33 TaxID=3156266 RepID=UPI003514E76A